MGERAFHKTESVASVVAMPGVEVRLTAEYALRAAIDSQVFAALRDLESLDGGRAIQSVYIALLRRLPNVLPDRRRLSIDSGFSESSVKRAIKLLEGCRLMRVERKQGKNSTYHMADLRVPQIVSECLAAIRKCAKAEQRNAKGRATSEPTSSKGRVISEPTHRVTCGPEVGSQVDQKEANKNQLKQQGVAADEKNSLLRQVLKRWGLSSASYLVTHGHSQSIPVLTKDPVLAARLIDETMKRTSWSQDARVGSRVMFLRENIVETNLSSQNSGALDAKQRERAFERAKVVAESLSDCPVHVDVDASNFPALLERGLKRLGESDEVSKILRQDETIARRVVAYEVLRDSIDKRVSEMTEREFRDACEALFIERPGIRRFYAEPDREISGLRLSLVQFLLEEEGKKGRGRFGNRVCGVSEEGWPIERSGRPESLQQLEQAHAGRGPA